MDPALDILEIKGARDDVLEAVARLRSGAARLPRGAIEIASFAEIRTLRLRRAEIRRIWADPRIASLKAPRLLQLDCPIATRLAVDRAGPASRRLSGVRESGRGVVVGVIDWGFDFAHPAFRRADGGSRVLALWDQRDATSDRPGRPPSPYGYGRLFLRGDLDRALTSRRPYAALGYHPGDTDSGSGAHGSHVADIAAGLPRAGGPGGVAPQADLVFCHLASGPLGGLANLGDSVRILEAVDFIGRIAGARPCVINMSVGRHGGPHTGLTLLERALDRFVGLRPNTQIVQSAGNYYGAAAHASGDLVPGRSRTLDWRVARGDRTGNELEIWYSNRDRFRIELFAPGSDAPIFVEFDGARALFDSRGREIGRIYHRAFDPNTPDHHVNVFLYKTAPAGRWRVRLTGEEVSDGRYDAWIERDPAGRAGQSGFRWEDQDRTRTIGSICNGFMTIAVGAADTRGPFAGPAPFASSGPTRDGRSKPDLLAPGMRIEAARSAPPGETAPSDRAAAMSGASQAAPYVAGVAALCLEAGAGRLNAHDLRRAVIGTVKPLAEWRTGDRIRSGAGLVQPKAAIEIARAFGAGAAAEAVEAAR